MAGAAAPATGTASGMWAARATLEVVLAARRRVAVVVLGPTTALELVDHLVEVVAGVLAQLVPHLAHPACHALGIVLVHAVEGRGVGQVVETGVVGAHHGEARHEPGEVVTSAVL